VAEITIQGLSFAYQPGREVLSGLSAVFGPGQATCVLGPNGCGKTTLLKLVLGLLIPPKGAINVAGQPVEILRRGRLASLMSYVPQSSAMVFQFKAWEMVMMGRLSRGPWWRYLPRDRDRAMAALERVGLARLAERTCSELSGGERQLVLIARSLAQEAPFMIMDEPAANLDYGNQFRLLDLVGELAEGGLSVILTTHHPEQAVYLGGRAVLVKDGRIMADGPARDLIDADSVARLYGLSDDLRERLRQPRP
jgi:iron complex transport system ATP-binding protein